MLKKLVFTAATLVVAGTAFAQTQPPAPRPGIDARQAMQEKRIQQGVESGRLTEAEAARMQKGEARIDAAQARASADGTVTKNEQHHLQKMTNHEDRAIYRQKHDRQHDRDHDGQRDHRAGGHAKP